ncbi:SDR family oxidoreductase [Pseudomaricurvus sp.]|uniref:SDR family oxidoreductase n=1 Tax=Pseudomaricurvus sp. TaxID=2004510 RepID=UPI003F6AE33A
MTNTETTIKPVAVITGGAGGMGLATAKIMGTDHHVIICDVNQQRLDSAVKTLQELGVSCESVICDITDEQAVDALAAHAADVGQVKAVIHTAGLSPQMGDPNIIMKVNALGTINISNAFYNVAKEGFALVNVSSNSAHLVPAMMVPTRSYRHARTNREAFVKKALFPCKLLPKKHRSGLAYCISKHFVAWYSKTEASRFGAKGARVVSVSPGLFDTEMGRLEEDHGGAALVDMSALKRFGKPEEIAEVLAFCASSKAGFLTGVDVLCDGGVAASKL